MMKGIVLSVVLAAASGAGGAQSCGAGQKGKAAQTPANMNKDEKTLSGTLPVAAPADETVADVKVLAEGQYGKADQPFVAVVRDPETYGALRGLAGELPRVGDEFFETHAVVAAFLGQRNTGGFSVRVTQTKDGALRVAEQAPQGEMLIQVITNPFIIVAVPEADHSAVRLEVGDNWKHRMSSYAVREGEFAMSGGIAGRVEKFRLEGDVSVTGLGNLKTFFLNLKGSGAARPRALRTAVTGLIDRSSTYRVPRLNPGTLVDPPNSGLRATAELLDKNTTLQMTFEARPAKVADGYGGTGRLKAWADTNAR